MQDPCRSPTNRSAAEPSLLPTVSTQHPSSPLSRSSYSSPIASCMLCRIIGTDGSRVVAFERAAARAPLFEEAARACDCKAR